MSSASTWSAWAWLNAFRRASRAMRYSSSRMIGCKSRAGPSTINRKVAAPGGASSFPTSSHRLRQIIGGRGGGSQIVHRGPALRDGLIRAFEGLFEFVLCIALRKQIIHHLKMQHQALE